MAEGGRKQVDGSCPWWEERSKACSLLLSYAAFKPELLVMASNSAVEIATKTMSWTDKD